MKKLKKIDYITYGAILNIINIISIIVLTQQFYNIQNTTITKLMYTLMYIIPIISITLIFIGIFKKDNKKEIHTKKTTIIILSIIIFSLILLKNTILSLIDGTFTFSDFWGFHIYILLPTFFNPMTFPAYILFIYGMCLNKTKKNNSKEEKNKRKNIWIGTLVISLIVFIAPILYFQGAGADGWRWFTFAIVLSIPILIPAFILIIISIYKIKKYK